MCAAFLFQECCGPAITTVKGLCDLISKMERNKTVQKRYQSQVKTLNELLSNVRSKLTEYPKIEKESNIIMVLNNLRETLRQGLNECNKLSETRMCSHQAIILQQIKNTLYAESQSKNFENLDRTLNQAVATAQLAVQLMSIHITETQAHTRSKQSEMIYRSLHPYSGVFECHNGEPPLAVTDVVAEPNGPYLMISWKDCDENASREVNKYKIMLQSATDPDFRIHLLSETCKVRITEKVKPWEEYNVQVRAVNKVDYGPWSEPLYNIVMNQSPPTRPRLNDISYNAISHTSLYIMIQRKQEHNKQQVTQCNLEQFHTNEDKVCSSYPFFDHTNTLAMLIRIPIGGQQRKYRLKYVNQWGESLPTEELTTPIISSLIPGKPHNVRCIEEASTTTEVWLTWEQPKTNIGAVDSFKVEKRQLHVHSSWEEIPLETGADPLESVLKNLKVDKDFPQLQAASTLKHNSQQLYRVVKNLKQDTPYQFRICVVNKDGEGGEPSEMLQTKTKLHEAFERAATLFNTITRYIRILAVLASTYQGSSIARVAQFVLSMYQEQLYLPAPPTRNPGSESDRDSHSECDESEEVETQM